MQETRPLSPFSVLIRALPISCKSCALNLYCTALPAPSPKASMQSNSYSDNTSRSRYVCVCARVKRREAWLKWSQPVARLENSSSAEEEEPWRRELVQETEGVSMEGLRKLRRKIDEGAPASQTLGTLVNDVIVRGQELLTTEVSRGGGWCP